MAGNKKAAIVSVTSIFLVAALIGAVAIGLRNRVEKTNVNEVSTSSKAADSLCQSVDYKDTCKKSLLGSESNDPKELMKHAFNVSIAKIGDVISSSKAIRDAEEDPRTHQALDICKEVLKNAISDFQRSSDKLEALESKNMDDFVADLKTWLSATSTVQTTCLDAFENTTGDAGEKMKSLLKTSKELSSNALVMVSDLAKIFASLNIPGFTRRLMSDETYPEFISASSRSLMQASDPEALKPNAVVVLDGSGQFKSIQAAVTSAGPNLNAPFIILVKAGVYEEYVEIPKGFTNIVIVGEGSGKTRITGNKNNVDGVGTFLSSTLTVNADGFMLKDIAVENTAGPTKGQAVALRVSGDKTVIDNCIIDGYQDTLYTHSYRQFYRDTTISGTIDFIFGDGQVVLQNCVYIVRVPGPSQGCMVTAQGRDEPHGAGGIVIQGGHITAEPKWTVANPAYLGRPWKPYARTIVMQTTIDAFIDHEGWSNWMNGTMGMDTCYYGEYANTGPGSNLAGRVTWKGVQKITPEIAQTFTAGAFIQGDTWVPQRGVPYTSGMLAA